MIGYAMFGTNDQARANLFYDTVLGALGAVRMMEFKTGAVAWGLNWETPFLMVGPAWNKQPATVGNGTMVSLALASRAEVDRMYAVALAAGGTDEGGPGLRSEEGPQAFYGAYFRDPDGNKLCIFKMGPA
jgi:catechol 2,3-dioxygenase-like lactoylglutathione lyase family enzyme